MRNILLILTSTFFTLCIYSYTISSPFFFGTMLAVGTVGSTTFVGKALVDSYNRKAEYYALAKQLKTADSSLQLDIKKQGVINPHLEITVTSQNTIAATEQIAREALLQYPKLSKGIKELIIKNGDGSEIKKIAPIKG